MTMLGSHTQGQRQVNQDETINAASPQVSQRAPPSPPLCLQMVSTPGQGQPMEAFTCNLERRAFPYHVQVATAHSKHLLSPWLKGEPHLPSPHVHSSKGDRHGGTQQQDCIMKIM